MVRQRPFPLPQSTLSLQTVRQEVELYPIITNVCMNRRQISPLQLWTSCSADTLSREPLQHTL